MSHAYPGTHWGLFFVSEKCCEMPIHTSVHTQMRADPRIKVQKCTVVYTHTRRHTRLCAYSLCSLTQQEFIWWIRKGPSCWEFVMFCLFMSIKSLVLCGCDASWAVHAVINLFCFILFRFFIFFVFYLAFLFLLLVLLPYLSEINSSLKKEMSCLGDCHSQYNDSYSTFIFVCGQCVN